MTIKIVNGDVIDALLDREIDYLIHQTNCRGGFGSGIDGQIRKRIPEAYTAYIENYNFFTKTLKMEHIPLGNISCGGNVLHLHSQLNAGRDGKRYTNYGAMATGFQSLPDYLFDDEGVSCPENRVIGLPYLMGCGLGGGDWGVVYEIIEHCLAPYVKEVIIYKLED